MNVGITIDCADPDALATFWESFLGYTRRPGPTDSRYITIERPDTADGLSHLTFQQVPEAKVGKARLHLDLFVDHAQPLYDNMVSAGAVSVQTTEAGEWTTRTLQDPAGNEFCLIGPDGRHEHERSPLLSVIDTKDTTMLAELEGFCSQQEAKCLAVGVDPSIFELSHVAFRTATFREYLRVRDRLEKRSRANLENVWNGRPISKLILSEPIVVDGRLVELIELIPPFHQSVYPMGWEHVGYVVGDGITDFGARHRNAITLQQFQSPVCEPYVIRFDDYTHAKFYRWSLKDVCTSEGATFDGFVHAEWAPDDDLAGPYPDLWP